MKLVDLWFYILKECTPLEEEKWADLYAQARSWQEKCSEEHSEKPIERLYAKVNRGWFTQSLIASSYLWIIRVIKNFQNGTDEPQGENELY